MRLEAMAMQMPDVAGHPNRIPFEGVLTVVDEASTRPPAGARGHRVVLTRAAAMEALPSLLGMAVGCTPAWDGHDVRRKFGLITEADLIGKELRVRGYVYGRDFPEVVRQVESGKPDSMGMSYELADAHVADMRAEVWTVTRAMFTGAAVLLRDKAAYRNTSFRLRENKCRKNLAGLEPSELKKVKPGLPLAVSGFHLEQKGLKARWS
jgi:hypothetical protein